jgi:hypothetical protein
VSEIDNPGTGSTRSGILDEVLRLGHGFSEADRPRVLEALSRLEPHLVAKATDPNLDRALAEAKRELLQQIEDEKTKREPKSNRLLRKKTT